MMKTVSIHVLSIMRKCLPPDAKGGRMDVTLPETATLGDLIAELALNRCLGVPMSEFHRSGWQVLVNGVPQRETDHILQEGDLVQVFPPMAGG